MRRLILIAHNLRSCHNVGSLLRTAEGLGVEQVILTGYTPYPVMDSDERLPHQAAKTGRQIYKTALGAEHLIEWRHEPDIFGVIKQLHEAGFSVSAVEQATGAVGLPDYAPPQRTALLVGREVEGIEPAVLQHVDQIVEIPMFGSKESFNVVQAAAMALYHCRFAP